MLHGIDISAYQTSFEASGQDFVFIKATEGRSYASPRRAEQAAAARKAGCVVGFYHFLWPGNISAQARYFVETCGAKDGDLLAADWETTSSSTHASGAQKDEFLREVKKLAPHHRMLLYANVSFWTSQDTTSYAGDGLWIADYVSAGKPRIKDKWLIHQYTSQPVDKNVAQFASRDALNKWATGAQA
ncbi:muramidase [Streptomyces sp. WAC 06725]|uniref:glycoside hydrolase family 25 protein n=1 Tax=Streptomyces sp. WAC 06725 TaxID=2203209 RepID=UPI000F749739|nr:glycoside hydrolase family 25 protein [Streptomyces sp. WAC 06725]RSO41821.1 muramidase [Streptomyces sp. WAC 06725]